MITGRSLPHPIPYQGSKRALAHRILALFPKEKVRLFEPFAVSAAVSIAAVANGKAMSVVLNDANEPLMLLWKRIIEEPDRLLASYEKLWNAQMGDERKYYDYVRNKFNKTHNPDLLFYLLARCVKASVRYNANGEFNQSPDNRRKGAKPQTMAKHVYGASQLLNGITVIQCGDFRKAIADATPKNVIYMDPPYQGVCGRRDNRYFEGLLFKDFVTALEEMNRKRLSFIISYDGRTGEKSYGEMLPEHLHLTHIEVEAGVSSQATLLGRTAQTIESLYVSPALVKRILISNIERTQPAKQAQLSLF
ncbi:MAG: Dam family site-specific DNA-(adenine-N6)-methyltransferase [bacterium]|nr:Dam family site-specific DNA-(adenine-N6)-methyltransferase [bacterium]